MSVAQDKVAHLICGIKTMAWPGLMLATVQSSRWDQRALPTIISYILWVAELKQMRSCENICMTWYSTQLFSAMKSY